MKKLIIGVAVLSILASCSSGGGNTSKLSKEAYLAKIDSLETKRAEYFKSSGIPPKELSLKSIQAYEFFVADYPEDEKAANHLFEAAKRYEIDLEDHENAIRLYQKVYDNYEGYEHHAMALFHIGNAYHTLEDTINAIPQLQSFMEKYPDHVFAESAEKLIEIARMGGEEAFFKKILEKAKKDSSIVG